MFDRFKKDFYVEREVEGKDLIMRAGRKSALVEKNYPITTAGCSGKRGLRGSRIAG